MPHSLLWHHNPRRLRTFSREMLFIALPFMQKFHRVEIHAKLVTHGSLIHFPDVFSARFMPSKNETLKFAEIDEWLVEKTDYWYMFEDWRADFGYSFYSKVTFFFPKKSDAVMFRLTFS
jgi:hypothetical protein